MGHHAALAEGRKIYAIDDLVQVAALMRTGKDADHARIGVRVIAGGFDALQRYLDGDAARPTTPSSKKHAKRHDAVAEVLPKRLAVAGPGKAAAQANHGNTFCGLFEN